MSFPKMTGDPCVNIVVRLSGEKEGYIYSPKSGVRYGREGNTEIGCTRFLGRRNEFPHLQRSS